VVKVGTRQEFETKASAKVEMAGGECFLLQSAGGGGYGNPRRRDAAALARDLAEGYVTPKAAKRDYK
jgi:N-methylhydantoinase B